MGLSLSQVFIKLRYLSNFYKNALEENIKLCMLTQNNDTDILYEICQSKIFSVETAQTCILAWD